MRSGGIPIKYSSGVNKVCYIGQRAAVGEQRQQQRAGAAPRHGARAQPHHEPALGRQGSAPLAELLEGQRARHALLLHVHSHLTSVHNSINHITNDLISIINTLWTIAAGYRPHAYICT